MRTSMLPIGGSGGEKSHLLYVGKVSSDSTVSLDGVEKGNILIIPRYKGVAQMNITNVELLATYPNDYYPNLTFDIYRALDVPSVTSWGGTGYIVLDDLII